MRDDDGNAALSRRGSAILVIALVVFILGFFAAVVGLRPASHWTVVGVTERMGLEGLGVDPEVGELIPGGLVGATEKSTVDIALGTRLHLALASNTRVDLGRPPGRWFRRTAAIHLVKGTVRLAVGEGGAGRQPVLLTAGGVTARADRSAFSASIGDSEACFSVGDGAVSVRAASSPGAASGSAEAPVPRGTRACYDRSGRPISTGSIDSAESDTLASFAADKLVQ